MDNTWVKLYRKIRENQVIRDTVCCQLLLWLFTGVDKKTGELILGRKWASYNLGLHESTFYRALKRLEKKYKIVTLKSNNEFTTVSLLNWVKYNGFTENRTANRTTSEQRANTYTRHIDNKTYNSDSQGSRCPLGKNGEHKKGCIDLIDRVKEEKGINGFPNYAKQINAIHKGLRAKFTLEDIEDMAAKLSDSYFWKDRGWDLMDVVNQLGKGGKYVT